MIKALTPIPRPASVAGGELQIAASQVDANGISIDKVTGSIDRHLETGSAYRDDELDFIMQVPCFGRIFYDAAALYNRIRRLEEEEWWLAVRIMPHLSRVGCVVAADAEDPAHGKPSTLAFNRH